MFMFPAISQLKKDDRMEKILTDMTGLATLKSADVDVGIGNWTMLYLGLTTVKLFNF